MADQKHEVPALPASVGTTGKPQRRVFTRTERTLWERIANTQTASRETERMASLVATIAQSYGATVSTDRGNVYATKGTPPAGRAYPCVVAHTDTVFDILPDDADGVSNFEVRRNDKGEWYAVDRGSMYEKDGKWWVNYHGLGGDDKCGVYLALNLMRTLPYAKAAFFRDEEIGCLGSHEADLTFFDDCAFVLQGDRRGNDDFVDRISGDLQSSAFKAAVEPLLKSHGFGTAWGAPTDVGALKSDGLGISAANMSAGYYDYHQDTEYVVEADLLKTQHLMRDIVRTMGHRRWPHVAPTRYVCAGHASQWDEKDRASLVALGYVEDDEGFLAIPDDRLAALWAEAAIGWGYGMPCPWCGSRWLSFGNDSRYVCRPTSSDVLQGPALEGSGCGRAMPITKTMLDGKIAVAARLNAANAKKRAVAAAARAIGFASSAAAHRRNEAPLGGRAAQIDEAIRDDWRQIDRAIGEQHATLDDLATRPRPPACPHCATPAGKMHWNAGIGAWVCRVCMGADNESGACYRRLHAARIARAAVAQGYATLSPDEFAGTVVEIEAWLATREGATALEESLIDAHDGHAPVRPDLVRPSQCASCGGEFLFYARIEDAWECTECLGWTVLSANGVSIEATAMVEAQWRLAD